MKSVIVDVDPGSDDAWALAVLLAEETQHNYEIIAITCTYGNTTVDYAFRNVALILEALQRQDIPVYKGSSSPLLGHKDENIHWHGKDGFGDKQFIDPLLKPQEENAVSAITRLAREKKDIVLICLGPLTNMALALRCDHNLRNNLKELWIMGGNTQAVGNVANTTAEFNFRQDPEAAYIVFKEAICPVVLLPWEPCIGLNISSEWRKTILGSQTTNHTILLNAVEERLYEGYTYWNPCDAILAAAFVDEKVIVKSKDVHLVVETAGTFTRGQCALLQNKESNVRVICEVVKSSRKSF